MNNFVCKLNEEPSLFTASVLPRLRERRTESRAKGGRTRKHARYMQGKRERERERRERERKINEAGTSRCGLHKDKDALLME